MPLKKDAERILSSRKSGQDSEFERKGSLPLTANYPSSLQNFCYQAYQTLEFNP